jgi:hypothetical protein
VTAIGGDVFAPVSTRFPGNLAENGSYVGLPLLVMVVLFSRRTWRTSTGKLLTILLIVVAVLSLGSSLATAGASTVPLPWALLKYVPLIGAALPVRFSLYLFLLLGMVTAMWLASGGDDRTRRRRWVLACLGLVLLFPNLASPLWHGTIVTPPFFSEGRYRAFIAPGENVLVIPAGRGGAESLRWQSETGTYFRLTAGYLSIQVPPQFSCWPIMPRLMSDPPTSIDADRLRTFMAAKRVGVVILIGPRGQLWRPVLDQLGLRPVDDGGVTVARVVPLGTSPPASLARDCPPNREPG